jgi:hypothetical protein
VDVFLEWFERNGGTVVTEKRVAEVKKGVYFVFLPHLSSCILPNTTISTGGKGVVLEGGTEVQCDHVIIATHPEVRSPTHLTYFVNHHYYRHCVLHMLRHTSGVEVYLLFRIGHYSYASMG